MRNPENGFELSVSTPPLSVCLNCGHSMDMAFAVPARHNLELRIFHCEHCCFEELILRPHFFLPAPKQLTHHAAQAVDTSQEVIETILF